MAPKRGQSIERTSDYDEFMSTLIAYHEERGTTFEAEPKIGPRHVSLQALYERVVSEGGYDLVSDTKAKPLMWRKLAEEFIGKNSYTAAQAFQLKSVYYRNLCAYEITEHWKEEPPPKEILEEVTAKGANVRGRTVENFDKPLSKEERTLQRDDDSDEGSPEQSRTPAREEVVEDPGTGGRSTRGLRQQPPQRVLFQPDLNPARQTRGAATHNSPTPGSGFNSSGIMNASSMNGAATGTLAAYEPQQSYPLSLKPVTTPANNPSYYINERKRKLTEAATPLAKKYRNIMLPGTGFIGPNIYVRAQLALQSGMASEEEYALHHLVKITHERGEKYQFSQFPGLAEGLVKLALRVSKVFWDFEPEVSYDYPPATAYEEDSEVIDGLDGTLNLFGKLRARPARYIDGTVIDSATQAELHRVTEATLVLRNMAMLDHNAAYLARDPVTRDWLTLALSLPDHAVVVEMKNNALETAEQVVRYLDLGAQDELYQALISLLEASKDRGAITTALRTVARVAMNLPSPKKLEGVSTALLAKCVQWLVIEDEELRSSALDLLITFTSFGANVEELMEAVDISTLTLHLSRLLLFEAKEQQSQSTSNSSKDVGGTKDEMPPVPRLSKSIVESLLTLDEPERSSEWLRMCFLPELGAEMTQISLWQAYQSTFAPFHSSHPHLIAGDFIKNVSSTFSGATAQVAGAGKYVIRGIKARTVPVDSLLAGPRPESRGSEGTNIGRDLCKCAWKVEYRVEGTRDPLTGVATSTRSEERECAEWFRSGDDMHTHILDAHLQLAKKPDRSLSAALADDDKMDIDGQANDAPMGKASSSETFDYATSDEKTFTCRWAGCGLTSADYPSDAKTPRTALFARHIATHLPNASGSTARPSSKQYRFDELEKKEPISGEVFKFATLEDEKRDLAGVPLGAALVLRNIARGLPPEKEGETKDGGTTGYARSKIGEVFGEECRDRMFFAMSHHGGAMKDYVGSVLRYWRRAEEGK